MSSPQLPPELRDILLSQILVQDSIQENLRNNPRTLVRVHLIPYNFHNQAFTIQNLLRNDYTGNVSCGDTNKRNQHVSHLPKYKKITENIKIHSDCSICQDNFKQGEYFRTLPFCKHSFHKKCIDRWMRRDEEMRCPLCRETYTPQRMKNINSITNLELRT